MTAPLREAHAHIAMLGRALAMPDLNACRSRAETLDRVRSESGRLIDPHHWLLCTSLRPESFADEPRRGTKWPTRAELDAVTTRRPCCILSFDHHAALANSAAFAAAGLDDHSPDPPKGTIVRGPDGIPTGLLLESAAWLVWNAAPEPPPIRRRSQVQAALAHLAGLGYTEIHDLKSPAWLGPLLAQLSDQGLLSSTIRLYPLFEELDAQLAAAASWQRPNLTLAGAKAFADGTINSRTAFMLHPFADPIPESPRGTPLLTQRELADMLARTASLNLELAVHAIGDAAVRRVLDAAESCSGGAGVPPVGPRLRIEHCELIDEQDAPRFAKLGVTAGVQPCHLLADAEALRRLLPHRLDRVLPIRDLIASGLEPGRTLLFGSDVPIVRADPADSIRAAVHRGRSDDPKPPIAPDQAIDETTAWECFHPCH